MYNKIKCIYLVGANLLTHQSMPAATNPANIPTTTLSAFEFIVGKAPLLLVESVVAVKIADVVEVVLIANVVEVDTYTGAVVEESGLEVVLKDGVDRVTCGTEKDVSVDISIRVMVGLEKL